MAVGRELPDSLRCYDGPYTHGRCRRSGRQNPRGWFSQAMKPEEQCSINGTHARLHQSHLLWHQAEAEYQNPEGFCTNLNAGIQALRSVTFVLQKEKDAIPGFTPWYEAWREGLTADPLMRWLVDARNRIEKQADLETYSSARFSLLSGWTDPAPLIEVSVNPLTTTEEMVARLPEFHLPPAIQKHGVLLIERRWVVREWPDRELLDILAHCYGVLARLVRDAHERCGFTMRTFRRDSHEPRPVRTEHLAGQLPCMVATRETRTLRLHLGTGRIMTPMQYLVKADPRRKDELLARYDAKGGDLAIKPGEDVLDAGTRWFEHAKKVLVKDRYHLPIVELITPEGSELHALEIQDRPALYVIMRQVADQVERFGATGLIHTAEAWFASPGDLKPGQLPSEVPTRREALETWAASSDGRLRVHFVEFSRDKDGAIVFGESAISEGPPEGWGFLEPVRQVWLEWGRRRGKGGPGAPR